MCSRPSALITDATQALVTANKRSAQDAALSGMIALSTCLLSL
jgi:hypothetical protein